MIPPPSVLLAGTSFASISATFTGGFGPVPVDWSENGAYLGLPVIIALSMYCVRGWRQRKAKILAVAMAVVALLSLGTHLIVAGKSTIWLPGSLLQHLPASPSSYHCASHCSPHSAAPWDFHYGSPRRAGERFSWSSGPSRSWPLCPWFPQSLFGRTTAWINPAFFQTNTYQKYLNRNAVVLPIPFAYQGTSTLWQADTHMYFRLASGYFGYPPKSYTKYPVVNELLSPAGPPDNAAHDLRRFIYAKHVDDVILQPDTPAAIAWMPVLADLQLPMTQVGGVTIYRVPQSLRNSNSAAQRQKA